MKLLANKLKLNRWNGNFSLKFFPVTKSFLNKYCQGKKLITKKAIDRINCKQVIFNDGTVKNIDLIIHATGYKQEFGFLTGKESIFCGNINPIEGLFFGFLSKKAGIFFVGHIYPLGPHWLVYEMQAKIIAQCIKSGLDHNSLLEIFKEDKTLVPYSVYNENNQYSRYIDINKFMAKGCQYLKIFDKKSYVQ